MTPLELYRDGQLWRRTYGRKPFVMPWQVRPYRREAIAPGVTLFTADRSARTLIVGFCGRSARLFLPVAVFLQALDHRLYDLVIASDARHLHFESGIEGYARSLPDVANRLSQFASTRGYGSIITYGISMGGLVALRAGELMQTNRAIAAGGRFVWHVGRLQRKEAHVGAFDLLCNCRPQASVESYAIFSEDNPEDVASAGRLAAISSGYRLFPMPGDDHNFPHLIHKAGWLGEYHRQIFDLDRRPDPAALRGLLDSAP